MRSIRYIFATGLKTGTLPLDRARDRVVVDELPEASHVAASRHPERAPDHYQLYPYGNCPIGSRGWRSRDRVLVRGQQAEADTRRLYCLM